MPTPPRVLVCEPIDPDALAWLAERCEVLETSPADPDFADALATTIGIVVRTYTQVTPDLLNAAPKLRAVARAGVGLDNIDLAACAARGVTVVHTPGANTRAVVELTTAFMLDRARPRPAAPIGADLNAWRDHRKANLAPTQLAGATLGIVGMGRVGAAIAHIGLALNMSVLWNDLLDDPEPGPPEGATRAPLTDTLAAADILTLHVDDRPTNADLFGEAQFDQLKPSAHFINTCRGFVVDRVALRRWLNANPGAYASLDVHTPEPIVADDPLVGAPNARLTAHLGAATAQAHANMSWVVKDLLRALNNDPNDPPQGVAAVRAD